MTRHALTTDDLPMTDRDEWRAAVKDGIDEASFFDPDPDPISPFPTSQPCPRCKWVPLLCGCEERAR